ncbi:lymphotactin [Echinops telfairi]|uniref:Lymphotactin n=1 Tax=Echinops telfairi TaxID=9371 RepID=A0AC55DQ65_ECHTE|nr:lymphotactin [Echinops telfairi]
MHPWEQGQGVGSEVPARSICVSLHTRPLPVQKIKSYTIKEGSMRAVILITKRGLKICADPDAKWVKSAIQHVDKKATSQKNMTQSNFTRPQQSTNTAGTLTS